MNLKNLYVIFGLLIFVSLCPYAAMAQSDIETADCSTLYGVSSYQSLYSIDIQTGDATYIGDTGFAQNAVISLAVNPNNGQLVGEAIGSLYRFDTTNATPTFLTILEDAGRINGLAFDSYGTFYGVDAQSDDLAVFDIVTGEKTSIGYTGISYFGGLAFNSEDTLYSMKTHDGIVILNTLNGSPTFIGDLGNDTWDGLAFDKNDVLYSTKRWPDGAHSQLVTIDTQDATVYYLNPITGLDSNLTAIAFGDYMCNSVSGQGLNFPEHRFRAIMTLDVGESSLESGRLSYSYRSHIRLNLESTLITELSVEGDTATITGEATVNGTDGFTFIATITDNSPDSMGIEIYNPDETLYFIAEPESIRRGDFGIE